ncbi:hypothetical protein L7F22_066342 [Adiantum nelumboides]|nr:hypothetical protein [Adiantum nelumboides]
MAASAPVLGTTQDAPRPITWTYELTPEDETEMQTAIEHFSGRTVVGWLVGPTPSRPTVREWIESALGGSTARILELSMMTASLFLLQLSDSVSIDALLARSPISSGSRLLVFQRWYPQFDQDEFDRQQQIPRFPVTLSFPSLPIFMRRSKRPEFSAWLAEIKKVNLETMPAWEEKQMFKEYMEDFNTATLPKKYYDLDAYHRRKFMKEIKRGISKQPSERTEFNDEEQRRQELKKERELRKEAEVEALKHSMQSGMAQAMKEQAQLREEMQYQYRLGNFEAANAIQRRLDPAASGAPSK